MSAEFDFLTAEDKPALLGITTSDIADNAKAALDQLGYKVHAASNHGEFLHKFTQPIWRRPECKDRPIRPLWWGTVPKRSN